MKANRFLATVLFTDVVGSTARAAELSDRPWRDLLERHHALVRRELRRHRGVERSTAGDGFLATFERPDQAIRCACAICDAVKKLGIEIRSGVHMGEVERSRETIGGLSVHIGARVAAEARPGEVLVSSTVRDTEVGSGFGFDDRGLRVLKGVPGEWRLFAVSSVPPAEVGGRREAWLAAPAARRARHAALALVPVLALAGALWFLTRDATPEVPPAPGMPPGEPGAARSILSEDAVGGPAAEGAALTPAAVLTGSGPAPQLAPLTESPGLEAFPSWSPDGESLAHVSERSGSRDVWIKALGRTADIRLTSGEAEETQPAWSPDGTRLLFVSSEGHGTKLDQNEAFGYFLGGGIWSVSALGGMPTRVLDGGFNPSWAPDRGRIAFDASFDGPRRVWVADSDGRQPVRVSSDASGSAAHTRPRWSPDGRWIAYQRQESGRSDVQVVPAEGGSPRWITRDAAADLGPSWTPDGGLVFSSDRGGRLNLWRVQVDAQSGEAAGAPVQVTAGAGDDVDPAVSPDGSSVAYASVRMVENLWRMPMSPASLSPAGAPQPVLTSSRNDNQPALSPDGRQLVFSSDRGGNTDLWIVAGEGGDPRRLTDDAARDMQPDWSPDGKRVAFFSDRGGNNDVWVVPVSGGAATRLTDDPADDINPYWSPDGKRIAFMSDRSGRHEVWVMDVDGGGRRRLTDVGAVAHEARWSPAGTWIAFTSAADDDRDVWVVPADGGRARRLTPEPTQEAHALWSADGGSVLYLTDHRFLRAAPLSGGTPRLLYETASGERLDDTHLSRDGRWLYFTLLHAEGDLWLLRNFHGGPGAAE